MKMKNLLNGNAMEISNVLKPESYRAGIPPTQRTGGVAWLVTKLMLSRVNINMKKIIKRIVIAVIIIIAEFINRQSIPNVMSEGEIMRNSIPLSKENPYFFSEPLK